MKKRSFSMMKNEDTSTDDNKKLQKCNHCDQYYSQHEDCNPYKVLDTEVYQLCELCGLCFPHQTALNQHSDLHAGDGTYVCNTCKKCFSRREDFNNHKLSRSDLKGLCEICGKCFFQETTYKQHMILHTINNMYECETCKKCFSQEMDLKKHISVHEKKLCNTCGMLLPKECLKSNNFCTYKSLAVVHLSNT